MKPATKALIRMQVAVLAFLFVPLTISAQGPNPPQKAPASLTGKYQGTAKAPGGDMAMTLEIVEEAGKFSGTVTTPHGNFKVIKGQNADGLLTLDAEGNGSTGKFSLRVKDDKLVGNLTVDGKTGAVDLRRVLFEYDPAASGPRGRLTTWRPGRRRSRPAHGRRYRSLPVCLRVMLPPPGRARSAVSRCG